MPKIVKCEFQDEFGNSRIIKTIYSCDYSLRKVVNMLIKRL